MQSYHFGWYTIFVLHKINLIESFKEYLIVSKDFLNFSSLSRYKVNLDYTIHTYFWDLCFHLTGLLFVLGFHSFTFALIVSFICSHDHLIYTVTITRSSFYTPFCLYTVTSLNGYLTTSLPHSTALTLNMKILICCIGV